MNKIKFDLPLQEGSVVQFIIGDTLYTGIVTSYTKDLYHVQPAQNKYFENGVPRKILHRDFVTNVFKPLNRFPEDYYRTVLGKRCVGFWPETSIEDLKKVLLQMKKDYEKQVESSIDLSRFRFRIGETILYKENPYRIAGYYFSGDFNDFEGRFGYVIGGYPYGHNGASFGYDEYGTKLPISNDIDKYYIYEEEADSYFDEESINNQKTKDKNEIRLQKTKAVIVRGEVPEGCRVCSKIHKTAISIQPISNTTISREG